MFGFGCRERTSLLDHMKELNKPLWSYYSNSLSCFQCKHLEDIKTRHFNDGQNIKCGYCSHLIEKRVYKYPKNSERLLMFNHDFCSLWEKNK